MADGTAQAPTPAPQIQAPTPDNPGLAPVPQSDQSAMTPEADDARRAEAVAEMNNDDAGSFLSTFLEDQGLRVQPDGQISSAPAAAPPGQQAAPASAPVQPPGNGAPAPPNGGPPAAQPAATGVPPHLLAALYSPPAPAPQVPPQPQWPQQPQQMQAPQPAPQQQPQEPTLPLPFTQAFQIPDNVAAAMEHDDPRVRREAIGAVIATAANEAFRHAVTYVQQNVAPQVAQATFGQVQAHQFSETVQRELYGKFPQLQYAAPALIQRAADVVVQDELSRNPRATLSPEIWARIGQLASAGVAQMAAGQVPQFQAQQPQQQQWAPPQQQWQPPTQQQPPPPPQPVWNGQQWVIPTPMPPAGAPFVAGQNGMPFGAPPSFAPNPESEFQSLSGGG